MYFLGFRNPEHPNQPMDSRGHQCAPKIDRHAEGFRGVKKLTHAVRPAQVDDRERMVESHWTKTASERPLVEVDGDRRKIPETD